MWFESQLAIKGKIFSLLCLVASIWKNREVFLTSTNGITLNSIWSETRAGKPGTARWQWGGEGGKGCEGRGAAPPAAGLAEPGTSLAQLLDSDSKRPLCAARHERGAGSCGDPR